MTLYGLELTKQGSHDNGYMGSLVAAQTNGYIDKIVVLRSYTALAREIQNLNLPSLDIPGLFRPNKMPPMLSSTPPSRYSPVQTPSYLSDAPSHYSDTQRTPPSPKKSTRSMRPLSTDQGINKKREPNILIERCLTIFRSSRSMQL